MTVKTTPPHMLKRVLTVLRYGAALLGVAITHQLLGWMTRQGFGIAFTVPLTFVIILTYFLGSGPGLAYGLLIGIDAWYFFIEPVNSFAIASRLEALRLAGYFVCVLSMAVFNRLLLRSREKVRSSLESLKKTQGLEAHLATIMESANDAIIGKTLDGIITSWNNAAEEIFGYTASEAIGQPISMIYPPDRLEEFTGIVARIKQGEAVTHFDTVRRAKNGMLIPVAVTVSPIRDRDGVIIAASSILRDVTERKRQEKLQQDNFRSLTWATFEGMSIIDNGMTTESNEQMARLFGCELSELIGRPASDFIAPHERERIREIVEKMEPYRVEVECVRKDGTRFIADAQGGPVDWFGRRCRIIALRDITERKKTEEMLRKSEKDYRDIFDRAAISVVNSDTGRFARVSRRLCEFFGYSEQELLSMSYLDLTLPEDREADWTRYRAFVEGDAPEYQVDKRFILKDGRVIWGSIRGVRIKDGSGRVVGTLSVIQESTERKQVERNLRLSLEILDILNKGPVLRDSLKAILNAIKREFEFDAVGLRVKDGDDYPYFVQDGFSSDFLIQENSLVSRDANGDICKDKEGKPCLECTCGLVVSGKTDPANPLFTAGGSAWTNNSLPALEIPADQDPRLNPRNLCIHQGYLSIALIPIYAGQKIAGLMQLNDRKKDRFTLEQVHFLESIGSIIGVALARQRQADKLRVAEERVRLAAEGGQIGPWDYNLKKGTLVWEPSTRRIFGVSQDEPVNYERFLSVVHPDDRARANQAVEKSKDPKGDGIYNVEYRVVWPDGSIHWLIGRGQTYFEGEGPSKKAVRRTGIVIDITERKIIEETLKAKTAEVLALMESIPAVVCVANDPQCLDMKGNETFYRTLRIPMGANGSVTAAPDQRAVTFELFSHGKPLPPDQAPMQIAASTGKVVMNSEFDFVFKDGVVTTLSGNAIPLLDANGQSRGAIGVFLDMTERKKAEEALRDSEARLALAQESGRVGIFDWDMKSGKVYWSYQMEKIYGVPLASFEGTYEGWSKYVLPEDLQSVEELIKKCLSSDADDIEFRFRFYRPEGSIRWGETRAKIFRDPSGQPVRMIGTNMDITDQKNNADRLAEMNKNLEEQVAQRTGLLLSKERELEHARRLEAVGSLAGGVAHDFNNLLTGITGVVQETYDSLPEKDPRREDLDMAIKAAQSAFSLTRQLLAFSRHQVVVSRIMDLSASLAEIKKMLGRLIGEDIRLRTELKPHIGHIRIDPGQLEQIVVNLAVNARDAMPKGGELFIESAEHVQSKDQEGPLPPGHYARFTMRDTGHGMRQETMDHIFEPFFTTKGPKGTGLGLSTVYGIVKQNGGHIYVHSQEGRGTTFDVFFPNLGLDLPEIQKQDRRKTVLHGKETVLVVEDEKIVRHVVTGQLRKHGYNVLEASNGAEALELVEHFHEPIHLLLTDVVMPGMNGRDLAQSLTQKRPELPVLYMSGYSQDILDVKGIAEGETHFIKKTYLNKELLPKVREVLDRKK